MPGLDEVGCNHDIEGGAVVIDEDANVAGTGLCDVSLLETATERPLWLMASPSLVESGGRSVSSMFRIWSRRASFCFLFSPR